MLRWTAQVVLWWVVAQVALIVLFALVNPPTNFYMASESWRLNGIKQDWVPIEQIAGDMARAVVAAEDADFCQHWGFDLAAIRAVVKSRSTHARGASTISQQVAKNVFLWPNRSWIRKFFEAETTVLMELVWSKKRIVEVYMNVAEFDEGVFGVEAAARHYYGVSALNLSLQQAAQLAAVLPNPKNRSAGKPSATTRIRATAIISGAQTIAADGRDRCFSG
jgi:monofunctional glycosyltransferase